MGLFAIVISSAILFSTALAWTTWSYFTSLTAPLIWELATAALGIVFIAAAMIGFRRTNPLLRFAYRISATWLGVLNYAMFASFLCWIVLGVTALLRLPVPRAAIAKVIFTFGGLTAIYGVINAAILRVTRITVPLTGLPASWDGRTAALVTDVHLGHISGPRFVRQIVRQLHALQPDVIFFSGDLFDGTPLELDRLAAGWRDLKAPRGVYYVTGNHDEFAERSLYLSAVERAGLRVLHNARINLAGLQIVGVHDSEATDPAALAKILEDCRLEPGVPSILLSHRPGNLAVAEAHGISLQLSGHTHRGQFFPWTLIVRRVWGKFAYGLNRSGKMWVYTSSGAGTWGPPVRVGTKSELVLMTFKKA